jgi:hypothetical protein
LPSIRQRTSRSHEPNVNSPRLSRSPPTGKRAQQAATAQRLCRRRCEFEVASPARLSRDRSAKMKRVIALLVLALGSGCAQIAMVPAYDGVVRDAKSGAAIQGATVSAMHMPRHEWKSATTSDSQGAFHLPAVKVWMSSSTDSKQKVVIIRVEKSGYSPFEQIVYREQKITAALVKTEPDQSSAPTTLR